MASSPIDHPCRRFLLLTAAVVASLVGGGSSPAVAMDVAAEKRAVTTGLDSTYPQLEILYKTIHAHPELAFQEVQTAALLAKTMRGLGFEVTESVGKTGLVAIYRNGPGPVVMVRTELDALPMEEETGLPYASRAQQIDNGVTTFVAHSCGHDIHMAIWVGTAEALLSAKARWRGTLMFVAQPAEETTMGAKAMLADGLFTRFPKPDVGFALHVGPQATGDLTYKSGAITASSDVLHITFIGKGGHGSAPSITIDPVLMASRFVVDLQSVVSREKDATAFGVVTVGAIHAGNAGNVIPDQATLDGTARSFDSKVRSNMLAGIRRTARGVAIMAGAPDPDVSLESGGEAVVNDPPLTQRTAQVFKQAFGERAQEVFTASSGSEDYSQFVNAGVPSVYFGIGGLDQKIVAEAKAAGTYPPGNHSPKFAPVPKPTIWNGVEAMTLAVLSVLSPRVKA